MSAPRAIVRRDTSVSVVSPRERTRIVTGGEGVRGKPGFLGLTNRLTPTQISADQNNYNPAGLAAASVLRLSSDATRNITGLSGGTDGRLIIIENVGANAIVLKDASASSGAANRFLFGADLLLGANQSAAL